MEETDTKNQDVENGEVAENLEEPLEIDEEDTDPEPPTRYNVTSYGWDSDVEGLVKRLKRGDIFVPGFQRGFVWNGPEKSRFIESLILGLPVPNIFLAQDSRSKSLNIVDGQQRLRSLRDFLEGEYFLSGSEIQSDLKGRYFSREVAKSKSSKVLADADARSLADAVLHAIVIKPDPAHDDEEKGHEYNQAIIQIFRRLNTSGKPLSAQEIRASIFYGSLDNAIRGMNEIKAWRDLFGKRHARLRDMELILRFIALRTDLESYRSPMPKFLNTFMESNRDIDEDQANGIRTAFSRVVELVLESIGRDGLRSGNALTVSRYDAIMAGFDAFLENCTDPHPQEARERLEVLEADEEYVWSISEFVNDTDRVNTRIRRAREIFGA